MKTKSVMVSVNALMDLTSPINVVSSISEPVLTHSIIDSVNLAVCFSLHLFITLIIMVWSYDCFV